MNRYAKEILNNLLDKYERSKSFTGDNVNQQSFTIKIADLYPKYADDSEYELINSLSETISVLVDNGFISKKEKRNGDIISVSLNRDAITDIYTYLKRTPKSSINEELTYLLNSFIDKNEILNIFCQTQLDRIKRNKKVEHFNNDISEYENILKCLAQIFEIKTETFERDFSAHVLGDSKAFEKMQNKVKSILFDYGDFLDKDIILEELNIIKNPGHVYFKGNGSITISGQAIDFSKLDGDFAVSSTLLKNIESINVTGDAILTVENLTTFNSFQDKDKFIIYLGGYHNKLRRDFIVKIYEQNPNVSYYHWGDIDAGGFYIYLHLCNKTGIKFKPYMMDIETLQAYKVCCKSLTEGDKKRLADLKNSQFCDVINYMLENNCKLEQEAIF